MGLADKLGLSKHSIFIAKVNVYELTQVPLVNAKFRVKWKFKTATSAAHLGLDGDNSSTVDDVASFFSSASSGNSGRRFLHPLTATRPRSTSTLGSNPGPGGRIPSPDGGGGGIDHRDSAEDSSSSSRPSRDYYIASLPMSPSQSPPPPDDHQNHRHQDRSGRTPNPYRTPTPTAQPTFQFNSPFASLPNSPSPDRQQTLTSTSYNSVGGPQSPGLGGAPILVHSSGSGSHSRSTDDYSSGGGGAGGTIRRRDAAISMNQTSAHPRAESKGSTPFIPLRSHTVTIKREIVCAVAITLKSSSSSSRPVLNPSPLKLSVRQEVLGDDGKKEEVKAGEVWLDLSQFVGTGNGGNGETASRRYLLKDSKTNATLRVSVEMEWVGGDSHYVAPPLKTGQIVASSASSIASTPSFNRSSSSVNNRRTSITPSSSFAPGMTRTNSSSSVSLHSLPSARSAPSIASAKTKGWRPSSSPFSSSPSPTLLGAPMNGTDHTATDIIDTIFNKPPRTRLSRQGSSSSTTRPPPPMSSDSNSILNFTTKRPSNNNLLQPYPSSNPPRNPPYSNLPTPSAQDKDSWFKIAQPQPPSPPTRPIPTPLLSSNSNKGGSSASSITSSHRERGRSVRWNDDDSTSVSGLSKHSNSGTSLSSLGGSTAYSINNSLTKTPSLRSNGTTVNGIKFSSSKSSTGFNLGTGIKTKLREDSFSSARSTLDEPSSGEGIEWAKSFGGGR